jgi:hypothetical protein
MLLPWVVTALVKYRPRLDRRFRHPLVPSQRLLEREVWDRTFRGLVPRRLFRQVTKRFVDTYWDD